jgi:dihydrofolate reductase
MHVALLAVVSLDGCLTKHEERNATGLSSPADVAHFQSSLKTFDASICGRMTYLGERPRLLPIARSGKAARKRIVMTSTPHTFADDVVPGALEFTDDEPSEILDRLRAEGHQRVAILGGGEVYNLFLRENLIDEVLLTIEVRIFGTGIRLAGDSIPIDPSLQLQSVEQLGPNTLLLTIGKPR